ncbi:MAG: TonB-dependent receptor [Bacteroidia bacterium]|nr:MAG: TonB-dependent receptor [Bacteroidia bacterium]
MRTFLTSLGLIFIQNICFSQITLNGTVKNEAGTAIPNATIQWQVSLHASKTIHANTEGIFSIPLLKANDKILIQASAVGHVEQILSIHIEKDSTIHLVLPKSNTVLEGVTINSRAKFIQMKPDKTIVNIGNNPIIAGSNIAEALGKIPGIQINNEQISIPGKGAVQLMQDGRLLPLSQKDLLNYLKSISSANISKIEIITNPSAIYDAGGNAGLINIITKRNTQAGYSGSIEASYRHWQEYPGAEVSGNINYNIGKWNMYANANFFQVRRKFGYRWEEYYNDRTWVMSDTGNYKLGNISFNAGVDYKISKKSNIGINMGIARYFESGADYVRNHFYNASGQTDSLLTAYATYVPVHNSKSISAYYTTNLDTTGKKFTIDGSYFSFYRPDESYFTGKTFLPSGQIINNSTLQYYYKALQDIDIYALKADWELPLKPVKLQFGAKVNFINIYSNTFYHRILNDVKVYDPALSIEYRYKENTQAAYINVEKTWEKWMLQAGLRGEYTQTNGYAYLTNKSNDNSYFKPFPSALIRYDFNDQHQFSLLYNKRINRPTFWNLNPFKTILTAHTYYEGNPFLQPAYINNFEFQHNYKNKLNSSLFLTVTNNGFAEITIPRADTSFVMRTSRNFVNNTRVGITETYNFSGIRWWESNNMLSAYFTEGRSKLDYVKSLNGWGAYFSSANTFYLNTAKSISAAINFWYQFPEVTLVNRTDAYWNLDFGVNATLLKDKLTLNTAIQDIFGTSAASYTNTVNNIKQKYATLQLNRNFALTLVYKFGKKEVKKIEHTESNEEERNRL